MSKADVVNEIHKNVRKNFFRRQVVMKDIDDLWQADLIDMQALSKDNIQYKYILVVIDTFSKYAWTLPIHQKTKKNVCSAFERILKEGRIPQNLQTDFGKEFYNEQFKKLMNTYNINHYSTYSTKKASIVERLIRTLKSKLYKEFSLKGNYKWMNGTLHKVVHDYNNSYHRTIGQCPAEVNEKTKNDILDRYKSAALYQVTNKRCKLNIGDFVRISKYKGTFEKGYTPNWSTEIFKISRIQNTNPVTYLVNDMKQRPILGAFYREELLKTKYPYVYLVEKVLKRKGTKLFVKWLGLSTEENSWIDKTSVL